MIAGNPLVEFVGEISDQQKSAFLGGAEALLFPIDWPEPFGLVMIEAMACGTPVVAFRCGSTPEVIEDGVTGYLVETLDQAVTATERAHLLDRDAIRARFELRFSATAMARRYLDVYGDLLARRPFADLPGPHPRHGGRSMNCGHSRRSADNPSPGRPIEPSPLSTVTVVVDVIVNDPTIDEDLFFGRYLQRDGNRQGRCRDRWP